MIHAEKRLTIKLAFKCYLDVRSYMYVTYLKDICINYKIS